jgi:hypothetical protein
LISEAKAFFRPLLNCVASITSLGGRADREGETPAEPREYQARQEPRSPVESRTARFVARPVTGVNFLLRAKEWTGGLPVLAGLLLSVVVLPPAMGQDSSGPRRLTAPALFPDNTFAYVRVDDSKDLLAKLQESSIGRMSADPQVAPILKAFYQSFNENFVDVQEEFGINIDEILRIPNGEMAFGITPGSSSTPTFVALIEAGDEMPALELILARAEQQMTNRGGFDEVENIDRLKVIQWRHETRLNRQFGYFIDSGVLVFCSDPDKAVDYAKIWVGKGVDHKPLAENRRFTSLLSRCVGLEGERPQFSFYVDPMAIFKDLNKDSPAAFAIFPMLTALGIDGLEAIGGSVILVPEGFDSIVHAHLMLANPRRGLLETLRPKNGDTSPPSWVAEDVATYFTANWKTQATIKAIKEIYETFRGPDAFQNDFAVPAKRGLGIDLDEDLLAAWDDRLTTTQVVLKPAGLGGISRVFGFRLKNARTFESTVMPKMFETLKGTQGRWTTDRFGSTTIYTLPSNPNPKRPSDFRRPEPSFTVVDNDLLVSDSLQALHEAIQASQSAEGLLNQSLEFKLVRDQVKQQLGSDQTSVVFYQRPEETLRMFYDMLADSKNIDKVREAKDNPVAMALIKALDNHQLPPFDVIAKYLSPAGGYVTEEENGLHYTGFNMRR